jgi:hypothetical protein
MKLFLLKNLWIIVAIPLFLTGCDEKPETIVIIPGETPKTLPATVTIKRDSEAYVITGIGLSGSNKVAIINDEVVVPGVEVGEGMVLKDIHPTYVTLVMGNTEYHLRPKSIQNELDEKKKD